MRRDVSFPSGDATCAAWWYEAQQGDGPRPCVILGHGFSLTRHDGLERYAEAFVAAGCHALAFDFRHLGDSGGEPRQRFRLGSQQQDYRAALAFAREQPGVDRGRLVLWGFSFAGGHVVRLLSGGGEPLARAGIVVCPLVDGLRRVLATPPLLSARIAPLAALDLAGRHVTIPVTGSPGALAALTGPGEAAGLAALVLPGSPWRNEISPGELARLALFRPVTGARRITVPLWVGRCSDDVTADGGAIGRLADRVPLAELQDFPGDHFWPLHGAGQRQAIDAQVAFLRRTVLA